MFSNFRDKMDRKDPSAMERLRAEQRRVERNAVEAQGPVEEAARRLYDSDGAAAVRSLENYSKGVYMSAMEAMERCVLER